jgi:hypothetical protein
MHGLTDTDARPLTTMLSRYTPAHITAEGARHGHIGPERNTPRVYHTQLQSALCEATHLHNHYIVALHNRMLPPRAASPFPFLQIRSCLGKWMVSAPDDSITPGVRFVMRDNMRE